MQFVCIFPYLLNICRKFEFLISQGSVATFLRWGESCCMGFVANFIRVSSVYKLWKSVKICQSYRVFKGGNVFWDTVSVDTKTLSLQVTPSDCGRWKEVAAVTQGRFPSSTSTSVLTKTVTTITITVTVNHAGMIHRYTLVKHTVMPWLHVT